MGKLEQWLKMPIATNLSQEQFNYIVDYYKDKADFSNSNYKEATYNNAVKFNDSNFDKSIIFLTSDWEKLKWGTLDSMGVGAVDLVEYQDEVENMTNIVKITPLLVGAFLLYRVLKK